MGQGANLPQSSGFKPYLHDGIETGTGFSEYDVMNGGYTPRGIPKRTRSPLAQVKEGFVVEERLKLAVFIDFDNIQIGVKDTLGKDFDVSIVLEALKERGEVVSKIAYGDWPRAGEYSRQMTQHAVQMVQRSVTPRGDKNGADINLALDALEMAFTRDHINTFVVVGGDSDFIALVEKLKEYDKRVFVVGGRQFTSTILQRNCHEFIAYENLLKTGGDGGRGGRPGRSQGRAVTEIRPLSAALPNVHRALQILTEREVAPQLGLLKSTLLQLDATFSERDYGASSFLEFIQKLRKTGTVRMHKTDRGYLVEALDAEGRREPLVEAAEAEAEAGPSAEPAAVEVASPPVAEIPPAPALDIPEALALLRQALASHFEKSPNRPLYMRQIRQAMRPLGDQFEDRAGYRALLDLLHQAQGEGWLRLHRDRKGVLRAFPVTATEAPTADVTETVEEPVESAREQAAPAEADVLWNLEEEAGAEAPSQEVVEMPAPAEAEVTAAPEAPPERKPRRARATKSATKRPRKASSRRKTKEPADS